MRLSRIWRILQIKEDDIHRSRPKAEVDNTLRDLQNSSYPTKAEFNNCFIIHSKYFPVLKGVSPFGSPKITQSHPQVFSVNGSIIWSGLHFWRHWFNMAKILSKFGEQQLVMVNYACGFNQSETVVYFEWIILFYIECPRLSWLVSFAFLRTFAPIFSAHPYCARKFTCHVMHERAR